MSDPFNSHSREPQKKSIFKRPILLGCFGFIVIIFIALGVGYYWITTTGKTVISDGIRKELVSEIKGSELSASQQDDLIAEIDRITEGFQSGKISLKQMVQITETLSQNPAMRLLRFAKAKGNPLENRHISREEKERGIKIIRRFVFGIFEERIPESAIDEIATPLLTADSNTKDGGQITFRPDITDDELRAALKKAETYADNAGIEDSDVDPDIAAEVRKAVDRILAESN